MHASSETAWIEARAMALGFDLCGVVSAEKFPELALMSEWLARGYAGEMKYLADPRRADPQTAMPGIRSVVVCVLNYNTPYPNSTNTEADVTANEPRGWISRYAWGSDYHEVMGAKLDDLAAALRRRFPDSFQARPYVDTGPVQERVLAKYAGLGWLGKNTLLLNQKLGSWFFLGVILTSLELVPTLGETQLPPPDLCGTCRRCLEACPTQALTEPYVLDARRCISYLTIELRGSIPEEFREPIGAHVFGCDICQDVCPWNRRAPVTALEGFQPRSFAPCQNAEPAVSPAADILEGEDVGVSTIASEENSLFRPRLEWLASLTEEEYRQVFRGSAVKRTKWRGLVRNACIALGNSQLQAASAEHRRIAELLGRLANSADPVIAESARWALSRIQ